jgi:carbon-monoxide dehydrogenase large subunit
VSELIGARVPRLEDQALLTGNARFVDDIASPGVLAAAFARSPHPHALIRGVDARRRARRAGRGRRSHARRSRAGDAQRRMMRTSNSGTKLDLSWPFALADGEVSFVGEPVAIIVASDRYVAEDAAALVAVDYEVLPAATDCRTADGRRRCAANFLQSGHRLQRRLWRQRGRFRQGRACLHEELWIHRGAAHSMEGRGILAQISDRETTVWASTQKPHDLRTAFADYIDLDESRLRVATPDVGGGFGPNFASIPRTSRWLPPRRCCAARSNGSRIAASISPMRRRSAISIGRSKSPPMPTDACAACAAALSTTSAPTRCRT